MQQASVRPTCGHDYARLARIQCLALHDSLLARLGAGFLERAFYPAITASPESIAYTLMAEAQPVGFAIYGKTQDALPQLLKSLKIKAALRVARNIFSDPLLLLECLGADKSRTPRTSSEPCVHLGFIAISPEMQGEGLGSYLLQQSMTMALHHFNASQVCVETRTEPALRFYLRNGFSLTGKMQRGTRDFYCLRFPE